MSVDRRTQAAAAMTMARKLNAATDRVAALERELAATRLQRDMFEAGLDVLAESFNRMRDALQAIADGNVEGVTFADDDLLSAFAQDALEPPT